MSFQSFKEKMAAARAAREAGQPAPALTTKPEPVIAAPKPLEAEQTNPFLAKLAAKRAANPEPAPWEPVPETEAVDDSQPEEPKTLLNKTASSVPVVQALPEVITAANLVPKLEAEEVGAETEASKQAIQQRIHELQTLNGTDLKAAMSKLRLMLLDNPSACALLLPEEAGAMVAALRRMTDNKVAATLTAARPTKKSKAVSMDTKMTPAQMAAALEEWD